MMKDRLEDLRFYQLAMELWDLCWKDTEILMKDLRGKEIAKQIIRSCGSIPANIEDGYGRGYGKEYPYFLKISRGSARETKGWYVRSKFLLSQETINDRCLVLDTIIASLTRSINTLERK